MVAMHQVVADAVAEWDDKSPLKWTMRETNGKGDEQLTTIFDFDLTPLESGYHIDFLLELKDIFVKMRKRIALRTIRTESFRIRSVLFSVRDQKLLTNAVTQIDESFLLALRTIVHDVPRTCIDSLKRIFIANPDSILFSLGLNTEDFPIYRSKLGAMGEITSRIITKALTRATMVEVLRSAENAYESKKFDIGTFSFCHLAFHAYCRPESYRSLTVSDFQVDIDLQTGITSYFIFVKPVKSRLHTPKKIAYRLNSFVGELVAAQRASVIEKYGHLIPADDIGKLALYPSRRLNSAKTWLNPHARANYGAVSGSTSFADTYMRPIRALIDDLKLNFTALRHTVGTQLAVAGCSAKTIQSVLRHASDKTCQAYVDLAFEGVIDRLSDSLQPAFEAHFPAFADLRSKRDPIEPGRAINSEDLDTGRRELTGECGRSIACQYAPLACYECPRFIPCYDADHSLNLEVVDREIRDYEGRGLAFRPMLEKGKHIRNHIRVVMLVSDQKLHALEQSCLV